jgi:hypothetical protein
MADSAPAKHETLQRFGSLFITLLAVALGRTLWAWIASPPSPPTVDAGDKDWTHIAFVLELLGVTVFSGGLFLFRRAAIVARLRGGRLTSSHRIFSAVEVRVARGIRTILAVDIVALLVAALVRLPRVQYGLIHAFVCVTLVICICCFDQRRHLAWLVILGFLAILFCPIAHLLTLRREWIIADWVTVILLIALVAITTVKANTPADS